MPGDIRGHVGAQCSLVLGSPPQPCSHLALLYKACEVQRAMLSSRGQTHSRACPVALLPVQVPPTRAPESWGGISW